MFRVLRRGSKSLTRSVQGRSKYLSRAGRHLFLECYPDRILGGRPGARPRYWMGGWRTRLVLSSARSAVERAIVGASVAVVDGIVLLLLTVRHHEHHHLLLLVLLDDHLLLLHRQRHPTVLGSAADVEASRTGWLVRQLRGMVEVVLTLPMVQVMLSLPLFRAQRLVLSVRDRSDMAAAGRGRGRA